MRSLLDSNEHDNNDFISRLDSCLFTHVYTNDGWRLVTKNIDYGWYASTKVLVILERGKIKIAFYGSELIIRNYASAVFRRYLCLEWTLMEQIKLMFSLKSELTSMSICSIRIRSRDWDTFEKSLQLNFNPSVHILEFYH